MNGSKSFDLMAQSNKTLMAAAGCAEHPMQLWLWSSLQCLADYILWWTVRMDCACPGTIQAPSHARSNKNTEWMAHEAALTSLLIELPLPLLQLHLSSASDTTCGARHERTQGLVSISEYWPGKYNIVHVLNFSSIRCAETCMWMPITVLVHHTEISTLLSCTGILV